MSRLEKAMKYEAVQADPADGEKLLALIESEAARGDLELIYTRRPNPVLSYQKEGRRVSFCVIKDENGTPCFMDVCIIRDYYFHGNATPFTYICGVRKAASPGGNPLACILRTALEYEPENLAAGFCSILDANDYAVRVFCRKTRKYFPRLAPLCGYTTFLMNPKAIYARAAGHTAGRAGNAPAAQGFTFAAVRESDLPEVYRFLEKEGKRYEMFPVIKNIQEQFSGLSLNDCYLLIKDGETAGFGALWDQKHYRQYIVKHYGGVYKYLRKAAGLVQKLGYIYLPPEGETANVLTLTLLTAKDGDTDLYRELLAQLAKEAAARGCTIAVAGMSKNNKYYPLFRKCKSVSFDSTIYSVETDGNRLPLPDPDREIHLECGYL